MLLIKRIKGLIVILILISVLLFNCEPSNGLEKVPAWQDEYERITRIEFPENYTVIVNPESNSSSFIKKTIIDLSPDGCKKFCRDNDFTAVEDSVSPLLFGTELMDSLYRLIPDRNKFLHKYGKRSASPKYYNYHKDEEANWVYLLDTAACRLYCLISMANLNGYAK